MNKTSREALANTIEEPLRFFKRLNWENRVEFLSKRTSTPDLFDLPTDKNPLTSVEIEKMKSGILHQVYYHLDDDPAEQ